MTLSASIAAVAAIDVRHYIGNATNGLGTIFGSGWTAYNAEQAPYFWKDRGVVHLAGFLRAPSSSVNNAMFWLPEGYRPLVPAPFGTLFPLANSGGFSGVAGFLTIFDVTSGAVAQDGAPPDGWVQLDGISFRADP